MGYCSRDPLALFADFDAGSCVTINNCTLGTWSDNNTNQCEEDCTGSDLQYSDNVTRQCVSQCELGWYGLNVSAGVGVCSDHCPVPEWADNLTV